MVFGTMRLRAVLENGKAMAFRNGLDGGDIGRLSIEVDRQNGACARRDRGLGRQS